MEAQDRLKQGDLGGASSLLEQALELSPDDAESLYLLGVVRRYQRRLPEALDLLERLVALKPGLGRAHQEAGHCLRAAGDLPGALRAYQRAVNNDSALISAWTALGDLHLSLGETREAGLAREQSAYLQALPPALLTVKTLIAEGKLEGAEDICRAFLKKAPHHPEAMRLLAEIGSRLSILDDAEALLDACVAFYPDNMPARFDYANLLIRRQRIGPALEHSEVLLKGDPDNEAYLMQLANIRTLAGDFTGALALYDDLSVRRPDTAHIPLSRGHVLKTVGDTERALDAYRRAYGLKPDFGDAYWSLANLKTYRFTEAERSQMLEWVDAPQTALVDRYHLCFALGKALEDEGDYAASFAFYDRGNALKREELRYDADLMDQDMADQRRHVGADLFAPGRASGSDAPDPIFIVGLPRAGSTLLEQILASHSQVEGTMELPDIAALASRLGLRSGREGAYPANLNVLSGGELEALGQSFLETTHVHRHGTPFFIDKMPNNFRHIGLIKLILPKAKIIDARREPMSCCFSNFKQLFASGQEFTYGLDLIGRYYRSYVDLMDHWEKVMPGAVLRVQYEDVVSDLETQVRRMLDFCGLPFEEACVNFHATERAVRTASSEQVRQPLFRSGLDQWEHYAPYLDPLCAALGEGILAAETKAGRIGA